MTIPSPLQNTLEEYQVEYTPQHDGEHREGASTGSFQTQLLSEFIPWGEDGCSVLATTGIVELEYAAIQKSAAIFDASNRSTIKITGSERLDCVSRLTTQQLLDMKNGESKLAFVTSRKGAVLADVVIHVLDEFILLDLDCTVANQLVEHIKAYIVMEDVHVEDVTDQTHWF